MIIGCELSGLDAMNSLGIWITLMTPSYELRALDTKKRLRL